MIIKPNLHLTLVREGKCKCDGKFDMCSVDDGHLVEIGLLHLSVWLKTLLPGWPRSARPLSLLSPLVQQYFTFRSAVLLFGNRFTIVISGAVCIDKSTLNKR
jgi:hypothetical protein